MGSEMCIRDSYTDANLKDGTTYRYRIQAKDADNLLSDFSDVIVAVSYTHLTLPTIHSV